MKKKSKVQRKKKDDCKCGSCGTQLKGLTRCSDKPAVKDKAACC
jgi:ribosomal protein L34E